MKSIKIIILMVLVALSSCKEHEIELYKEEPMVKFMGLSSRVLFDDNDYAHKIMEKDLGVRIELMGLPLTEPRTLVLKCSKKEGEKELVIKLEDKYLFAAGQFEIGEYKGEVLGYKEYSGAIVKVQRPGKYTYKREDTNVSYEALLTFDKKENNPLHQFNPGLIEWSKYTVSCRFHITQPINWQLNRWGAYSIQKYIFMMDVMEETYSEFNADDKYRESHKKIYDAYEKYKVSNGEITDDDGTPISFPETIG